MSLDDKYTYPNSGGVLVNRYGIHDDQQLDRALNDIASAAWADLKLRPFPERFDIAHLQDVHRDLFEEILPFAGQIRDVDAGAGGTSIAYCRPEFIASMAADIDRGLEQDGYLRGMPQREFADRLGHHWGEITALHPMRDGNTRSQSAFVTQLAASAGYRVQWEDIDVDTLRDVRLHAVAGSDRPLADFLHDHLAPIDRRDPAVITETLDGLTFDRSTQRRHDVSSPGFGGGSVRPVPSR